MQCISHTLISCKPSVNGGMCCKLELLLLSFPIMWLLWNVFAYIVYLIIKATALLGRFITKLSVLKVTGKNLQNYENRMNNNTIYSTSVFTDAGTCTTKIDDQKNTRGSVTNLWREKAGLSLEDQTFKQWDNCPVAKITVHCPKWCLILALEVALAAFSDSNCRISSPDSKKLHKPLGTQPQFVGTWRRCPSHLGPSQ